MIFKIPNATIYEKKIFLHPGELHIAKKPSIVWTTLGSCVSVVLFHPYLQIGSICHAQLPGEECRECCTTACPMRCYSVNPPSNQFRFVTYSIEHMVQEFVDCGINLHETEAKIFGGSSVCGINSSVKSVGERNTDTALKLIQKHRLRITGKSIGGTSGRRIYFLSDTGEIFLNRVKGLQPNFH